MKVLAIGGPHDGEALDVPDWLMLGGRIRVPVLIQRVRALTGDDRPLRISTAEYELVKKANGPLYVDMSAMDNGVPRVFRIPNPNLQTWLELHHVGTIQ